MPKGDFAKAFSQHRKDGGVLTRKEFADQWNLQHKKSPIGPRPEVDSAEERVLEND